MSEQVPEIDSNETEAQAGATVIAETTTDGAASATQSAVPPTEKPRSREPPYIRLLYVNCEKKSRKDLIIPLIRETNDADFVVLLQATIKDGKKVCEELKRSFHMNWDHRLFQSPNDVTNRISCLFNVTTLGPNPTFNNAMKYCTHANVAMPGDSKKRHVDIFALNVPLKSVTEGSPDVNVLEQSYSELFRSWSSLKEIGSQIFIGNFNVSPDKMKEEKCFEGGTFLFQDGQNPSNAVDRPRSTDNAVVGNSLKTMDLDNIDKIAGTAVDGELRHKIFTVRYMFKDD